MRCRHGSGCSESLPRRIRVLLRDARRALTALGDARARQLRDSGGRRGRLLGALDRSPRARPLDAPHRQHPREHRGGRARRRDRRRASPRDGAATGVAAATAIATVVILFLGEIIPKTLGKRHPVRVSLAVIPFVQPLSWAMWPLATAVTRATSGVFRCSAEGPPPGPAVTSEEIEYLIEMGTREGVLDEVKEELLNSVLEFADRVAKEIMVPRTRMVAIDRDAPQEELFRIVTENPFSRMPVYEGSIDNVVGVLLVREIIQDLRLARGDLARPLPEARVLRAGGDEDLAPAEGDAAAPHAPRGRRGRVRRNERARHARGRHRGDRRRDPGRGGRRGRAGEGHRAGRLARRGVHPAARSRGVPERAARGVGRRDGTILREVRFPEEGDYETLGGFVTATAGRVPAGRRAS